MVTALVASTSMLLVTVLIVDDLIRRREARRWRTVAGTAYRELSTDAFAAWTGVMTALGFPKAYERFVDAQERVDAGAPPATGGPSVLPESVEDVVNEALNNPKSRDIMSALIYEETEALGRSIARWAPVMLGTSKLAVSLDLFSDMREALISANRGFFAVDADPNWRWGWWVSLEYFFLLFARFDSLRREALGEPTVFGTGEANMRRALGLPPGREIPPDIADRDRGRCRP